MMKMSIFVVVYKDNLLTKTLFKKKQQTHIYIPLYTTIVSSIVVYMK